MKLLSIDLRERVLAAVDAGQPYEAVAGRFAVSISTVGRLFRRRARTGSAAPRPHAGGFPSVVDGPARAALRELVAERPDATLAELRDRLAGRTGGASRVCVSRVCQVPAELRLPRKKSRRPRRSGTAPT